MTEPVALKALYRELSNQEGPAQAPVPEVESMIAATNAVAALVNQRDQLLFENGLQRQRIAELEGEYAQYRANTETEIRLLNNQIGELITQRDHFRDEADGYRDHHAAIERILERSRADGNANYAKREKLLRTGASFPKDDGEPIPRFLSDKVTPIKQGKMPRG